MTSRNGEVAKLVRQLARDGWDVRQSKKGCHFHVRDPETGHLVTVFASSPSDPRSLLINTLADIRRYLRRKEAAA